MSWGWQKTILPNGSLEILHAFYKVTRLTRVLKVWLPSSLGVKGLAIKWFA